MHSPAQFAGNDNYKSGTSAPAVITITKAASTVTARRRSSLNAPDDIPCRPGERSSVQYGHCEMPALRTQSEALWLRGGCVVAHHAKRHTFGRLLKRQRPGNTDKYDRDNGDRLPDFLKSPTEPGASRFAERVDPIVIAILILVWSIMWGAARGLGKRAILTGCLPHRSSPAAKRGRDSEPATRWTLEATISTD